MTNKQPTHLVVDGSNIATEGRSAPSLEQLDEAVRAILEEYPHDRLTVVVDATFGHRIDESERPAYEEAILAGEIVAPPAGAIGRGDAFILQVADKADATVFSNDSFQEFHGEHEWLFDEGRLVGGKPVPGVGWVFVNRVPVRGPASRRSVRESKRAKPADRRRRGDNAKAIEAETRQRRARKAPPAAAVHPEAAPDGTSPSPPRPPRAEPSADDAATASPASTAGTEALNDPPVFLAFITRHRIGSVLEATVDHFSSHGAYVIADGARCYLPTKTMGDPPPNRARDVIDRDDTVRVEVQSLDAQRRGINVRFLEVVHRREEAGGAADTVEQDRDRPQPPGSADASAPGPEPRSDSDVASKRTAAKKSGAERAPSGRTPVKKAPAKKAAAEATPSPRAAKAAAKKAPAEKAATKRATTKKATATKATAKKAAATKAPAAAAPAKKAAGRKAAAATKATAKKAPAKKAAAEKAPAKKAAAEKAPAKKAAAEKAPARKATAKKATAKKATAKKATAKKATARKATARKATPSDEG